MKKKILLCLLVLIGLFMITGCGKKEETTNIITILSKDKDYYTTFKSSNNMFIQKKPEYMQIDSEELGVFITFQYIESPKETYDYYKTHNLFGYEYSDKDTKDYTWNGYSGYTYSIREKELSFRILLKDDKENSVVLSGYVGDIHTKDIDLTKDFDIKEIQNFFNTIEFIEK